MTRHAISIGPIAGIEVRLDYSWFLIFGLTTWMLAVDDYPTAVAGAPTIEYWSMGAVTAALLFVSVLLTRARPLAGGGGAITWGSAASGSSLGGCRISGE